MKRGKVVGPGYDPQVDINFLNQEYETTIEIGDLVFARPPRASYFDEYYLVVDITPKFEVMSVRRNPDWYNVTKLGRVSIPAYHCVRFADQNMNVHTKKHIAEYLVFRHMLTPAQEHLEKQVMELEKQRAVLMSHSEKAHDLQNQLRTLGVSNRDKLVLK